MVVSVNVPLKAKQHDFSSTVIVRITRMFARISHRLSRVHVTLSDENGPRGGVDMQCRIAVMISGCGEIVSTATDANLWVAFDHAARRARRIVLTKIKRPQALRDRYRRVRVFESETADL